MIRVNVSNVEALALFLSKEKEFFTYDKVGNRLSKTTNNITEKYVYNVKNQLKELHHENGTTYFTHDKQGNTIKEETNKGNNIFEYNPLNQQIKAITKEGNTLVNRYDAEGLRYEIEKNEKLTRFIFHKDNILVETDKDYNAISRFTRGYEIVATDIAECDLAENKDLHLEQDNNLSRYYYTVDEQGSTIFITDKDEGIRNSYHYDAFGNILDSKEEVHNRIIYTGQQFDKVTQQYYLRARFYNPAIGRFTQEDTYRGDGLNLYAYCANNPVVYYDFSGYAKAKCDSKNDIFANMSTDEKGKLGERIADHQMKKEGYKKYPSKVGSNNGFDGVYIKFDKKGNVNDIVINESKFNTARLGEAKLGYDKPVKQMSDKWIKGNLNKMVESNDRYVRKTAKLINEYLEEGNSIKKSLNRVRIPTKIKRKHTTNEWKILGKFKDD